MNAWKIVRAHIFSWMEAVPSSTPQSCFSSTDLYVELHLVKSPGPQATTPSTVYATSPSEVHWYYTLCLRDDRRELPPLFTELVRQTSPFFILFNLSDTGDFESAKHLCDFSFASLSIKTEILMLTTLLPFVFNSDSYSEQWVKSSRRIVCSPAHETVEDPHNR